MKGGTFLLVASFFFCEGFTLLEGQMNDEMRSSDVIITFKSTACALMDSNI